MNSSLIAWARRHVPVDPLRALHELHLLLGLDYPDETPRSAAATEAGVQSRARLAPLVGKTVHLNLWVRTDRNWTRRLGRVRQLGYL